MRNPQLRTDGLRLQPVAAALFALLMVTSAMVAGVSVTADTASAQQASSDVLYRVNAGGPTLSVQDGPDWSADSEANPSQYRGSDNTQISSFSDNVDDTTDAVPDGTPFEVFTDARWGPDDPDDDPMQWDFPIESGTEVEVRLYFAEPYVGAPDGAPGEPGQRQFDVSVEGEQVLSNYDIYADVGYANGTMEAFTTTVDGDGTLDVDFDHGAVENPIVSGIEVVELEDASDGNLTVAEAVADENAPTDQIDLQEIQQAINWWSTGAGVPDTGGETISLQGVQQLIDTWATGGTVGDGDANQAPTATIDAPSGAIANQTVTLDGSGSSDPDGSIASYEWDVDGDGATDATGQQIAHAFETTGDHDITLTVTDDAGATDATSVTVTVLPESDAEGEVVYRINAGGDAVTVDGQQWSDGDEYATGGEPWDEHSIPSDGIAGTGKDVLYLTERHAPGSSFEYALPVSEDGQYRVVLHFAEIYWGAAGGGPSGEGQRLFSANVEGGDVELDGYDLYADVGPETAVMKTYDATVTDGALNVDFTATTDGPQVAAIEVYNVSGDNDGPTPELESTPTDPAANMEVTLDASASTDPDGSIVEYRWDVDGVVDQTTTDPTLTHVYGSDGRRAAVVTVVDDDGAVASDTEPVDVDGEVVYRVNNGGPELDVPGLNWEQDDEDGTSQSLVSGGDLTSNTPWPPADDYTDEVPAYAPPELFVDKRFDFPEGDEMHFDFPAEPGQVYEVRLYFRNGWSGTDQVGDRIYSVAVEDEKVLDQYDAVWDVGDDVGTMRAFVVQSDDDVDVDFAHGVIENPNVNGIEIVERNDAETTSPPELDPVGDQTVAEDETLTVDVSATDADGDSLSLHGRSLPDFVSFSDDGDGTGTLTLAPEVGDAGTYDDVIVSADDGDGLDSEVISIEVTEEGTGDGGDGNETAGAVLYRVNAGGAAVSFSDGPDWTADSSSSPSQYRGDDDSQPSSSADEVTGTANSVPDDTPDAVWDSARYDPPTDGEMQWEFPVEAGTEVTVRIYTGENYVQSAGERQFDVSVEGEQVLSNYDIYADVGYANGTMEAFTTTVDGDGTLDVDFEHGAIQNPIVYGIEVIEAGSNPNEIGVSTGDVEFGSVTAGESVSETLTLTNLGDASNSTHPDVTVDDASIAGTDPGAFSTNFSGSTTLAPGDSIAVDVTFSPSSEGAKTATLEIDHTGENSPATVSLSGEGSSDEEQPISFGSSELSGAGVSNPTALDVGPDGRLYVTEQSGTIHALAVERTGENSYEVTDSETIDAVADLPNHDDDGSYNPGVTGRTVTGLEVAGNASNPVLYVTSSDPRIGGGGGATDVGLDTNSGVVSRLTWTGAAWDHDMLVRGLPRSEQNHATNGVVFGEQANALYVSQGGMTGAGAPNDMFAFTPEYALSAAILEIDLDQIESNYQPQDAENVDAEYLYDLPTVDETDGVFGGEDGLDQALFAPNDPVDVYAPGFRNSYDLTLTEDGQLYATDNGVGGGWGLPPVDEGPEGVCTNEPNSGGSEDPDQLHLVTEGFYGGHPNPIRANPDGAGLYDPDGTQIHDFDSSDTPVPFDQADPRQCDYLEPGQEDGALTTFGGSTDGIDEYAASNFGGAMQGDLLTAQFSGDDVVHRIQLDADGDEVTEETGLLSNFGSSPLDVHAQGDDDPFPGTVWVATFGSDAIHVFEPGDYDGGSGTPCTGADDASLDEDGDGYDNADEIDAGTDPCSAGDQPADVDGDGTSDLNDPDDDNDGVPDTTDPFALDPDDGTTTNLPVELPFDPSATTEGTIPGGLGFTGLMANGTDYADLYEPGSVEAGGAVNVLTVEAVPTTSAYQDANTQEYAFQLGVNHTDEPFVVHSTLSTPFPEDDGGLTPQDFQNHGVYVGNGDQSNYLKLVAIANGGTGGIQFVKEVDDGATEIALPDEPGVVGNDQTVDLYVTVHPSNGTAVASYAVDGGENVTVGETTIPDDWFADDQRGMAVGLLATASGAEPYPASWDDLTVREKPTDSTDNAAPTIDPVPDQTLNETETATVEVTASDADGDPLSLSASGLPSFATFVDGGDGTGTLEFAPALGDSGTYQVTVTASDGQATADETVDVTVELADDDSGPTVLYRVNAGGPTVSDDPGWTADSSSSPSQYRGVDNSDVSEYSDAVTETTAAVPNGTPTTVLQTARFDQPDGGDMQWEFPVESGANVTVRLYFAEPYFGGPDAPGGEGQRQFDVSVEGEQVLSNYDIYADVGYGTGTMQAFTTTVDDGVLDVDFAYGDANNPIVFGIEVVEAGSGGDGGTSP